MLIKLPPGLIFSIAKSAGLEFSDDGDKRAIRCPFHDDRHPSAFLSVNNVFYCSVCTGDSGFSAKAFCARLGVPWDTDAGMNCNLASVVIRGPAKPKSPGFTPKEAKIIMDMAMARALEDNAVDSDTAAYLYLYKRGVAESWNSRSFGLLGAGMNLPPSVKSWADSGHRVVVPLYNLSGKLVSLQGRTIFEGRTPKTLCPKGSPGRGVLFANEAARAMLRGQYQGERIVIFGEGLTDFLAYATVTSLPTVCAPGTGVVHSCAGPWVANATVLLALDCDDAGNSAVAELSRRLYLNGAKHIRRIVWPGHSKDACDALQHLGHSPFVDFIDSQI